MLSKSQCKKSIQDYFSTQTKYKNMCDKFNQKKKDFYADMEEYFKANVKDDNCLQIESEDANPLNICVKRIQSTSVKFNADKVEKSLPKDLANEVIVKEYKINDMQGLVTYLKECGVEPEVFKSFITTIKSVDVKELERLEELGKIDAKMLKGCYTVKANEPYFKVTSEKVKGE